MSCYVIQYQGGAKVMRPVKNRQEYLQMRGCQRQQELVAAVRQGNVDAKRHLMQFNYSLAPSKSPKGEDSQTYPLRGCTAISNSVGMDVDHITPEQMPVVKERILSKKDELGLLMLELSARAEGYHLVFERRPEMSQEENLRWASNLLGVEYDAGAKDVTRVFYATTASEEDLIYLHDALFVNKEYEPQVPSNSPKGEDSEAVRTSPHGGTEGGFAYSPCYMGTPYTDIVAKYWEMFNEGKEPCEGNRNVLTYELAMTLRPICDYSQVLMEKVIPNYWANDGGNASEQATLEWKRTIQNALNEPRKGMPYRLRQVLKAVKEDRKLKLIEGKESSPKEELEGASARLEGSDGGFRPKRMPAFLSLLSSKVPLKLKAMVEEAIWPAVCAHLHGVTFRYIDGVLHEPNICSPLIARQSSGKGRVNEPIECLLADITARDKENSDREKEWRRRNQGKGASKDRQPRPEDICIQRLDDDLTPAALAQALIDVEQNGQKRIITKVDEIELLNKVGNGRNDTVGLLVRYGFDTQRFGQRRVGLDSVNGSYTVRWVWNASCTLKSARKFINNDWIANGSLSRLNINALLLDKDDHELPKVGEYDEKFMQDLKPYVDRLNAASGLVECPQADKLAQELLQEHERIADMCESEGYRTLSYRAVVIGWLKACMLYIAHGYRWEKCMADYVRYSVRRDMYLKMHFFGQQIEEEFAEEERQTSAAPKNMLALLPQEFTYEQYQQVRQMQGKSGEGKSTLRMWKLRGYIEFDEVTGCWVKRHSVTVSQ